MKPVKPVQTFKQEQSRRRLLTFLEPIEMSRIGSSVPWLGVTVNVISSVRGLTWCFVCGLTDWHCILVYLLPQDKYTFVCMYLKMAFLGVQITTLDATALCRHTFVRPATGTANEYEHAAKCSTVGIGWSCGSKLQMAWEAWQKWG